MAKIILEGKINPEDVDTDDGGCAKIFHLEDDRVKRLFVRIQSWSESLEWSSKAGTHPEFDELIGKRIRVTIETID